MATQNRTFIIENIGEGDLILDGDPIIEITGDHAADFEVTLEPSSPIEPSSSDNMIITFTPSGVGLRTATVSISNNDEENNPYTFAIQGTGTKQVISIEGNEIEIVNGSEEISLSDNTDFGEYDINLVQGVENTFVVKNTGTGVLNLTGDPIISISGEGSNDFTVTKNPSSEISSSGEDTFKIRFKPTQIGSRLATVSISSDDTDNNPYTFLIGGVGKESDIPPVPPRSIPKLIGEVDSDGYKCKFESEEVSLNSVSFKGSYILAVTLCQYQDEVYKIFKREGLL